MWNVGTTGFTSQSYNCNVLRNSLGIYLVSFINSATSNRYAVVCNGVSGSAGLATVTASLISPIAMRTNGFTMSVQKNSAATQPLADFTTASLVVFSY